MYRCHFTERKRIVAGENLQAPTLAEAIEAAEKILAIEHRVDKIDGFEIWHGASLLYTSAG